MSNHKSKTSNHNMGEHHQSNDVNGGSGQHESDHHSKHEDHGNHHEQMVKDFKRRFIFSSILSIPVILLSPIIQQFFGYSLKFEGSVYISLVLSTVIYIYGGWPFFKGFVDEIRESLPGMMTLVTLAISVAYIYSALVVLILPEGSYFFWELATLIVVMLLGHWIEMRSVMGASQALKELAKLIPSKAHLVEEDGSVTEVETESLTKGDTIIIKPGEKIPTDGLITKGTTSVNESMITGESKPVTKSTGDEVIGGSVNGESSIRVKVEKTGKETYLSQVMNLVEEAQKTRSRAQDLANRAAFYLTIISITVGLLTLITWIFLGQSFLFALERMVTVMVITCPHALGLAVPLVVAVSTSISAQNGVLVRNRASFERARNVEKLVFDKTGTLTRGEFGVTDIISFTDISEDTILQLVVTLESESEHSIARGIIKSGNERGITPDTPEEFEAIPGKGIKGKIDGTTYLVVSPAYLDELNISHEKEEIDKLHKEGKTVVFLLKEEQILGALGVSDIIREESRETISRLKSEGIVPIMLTGDNKEVASYVAAQLGIEEYYAEVLPDQKSQVIKRLQNEGYLVGMVGDGINDAPALVQADIGMAIGAGTDVAIESADIILVKDNPMDAFHAIILARKTYGKMKQNLFWATGYNAVAIPLAAGIAYNIGIVLSPAVGAALMSLSTVIVAINSKLFKFA